MQEKKEGLTMWKWLTERVIGIRVDESSPILRTYNPYFFLFSTRNVSHSMMSRLRDNLISSMCFD